MQVGRLLLPSGYIEPADGPEHTAAHCKHTSSAVSRCVVDANRYLPTTYSGQSASTLLASWNMFTPGVFLFSQCNVINNVVYVHQSGLELHFRQLSN